MIRKGDMRKPLWVLLAVLLAIPAVSYAQYNEEQPAKINLRGGLRQPAGSRMKDQASNWPEFGIDYVIRFDETQKPQDVVSVLYTGASKNLMDAKLMGLQYMRYFSDSPEPDKGLYYGAGSGVFLSKARIDETFLRPAVDESETQFGLSAVVGYHFGPYWFAEVRYNKLPELADGVDLSGLSVFLGAKRFLE